MGALAYELRGAPEPEQPRLFAVSDAPRARHAEPAPVEVAGATVVSLPVVARPRPAVVEAARPARTLDDVVSGLFRELGAGRQSTCGLCGGAVRPRPVAAGAAGTGRCDGCGTEYGG